MNFESSGLLRDRTQCVSKNSHRISGSYWSYFQRNSWLACLFSQLPLNIWFDSKITLKYYTPIKLPFPLAEHFWSLQSLLNLFGFENRISERPLMLKLLDFAKLSALFIVFKVFLNDFSYKQFEKHSITPLLAVRKAAAE